MRALREAVKFLLEQQLEHFPGAQEKAAAHAAAVDREFVAFEPTFGVAELKEGAALATKEDLDSLATRASVLETTCSSGFTNLSINGTSIGPVSFSGTAGASLDAPLDEPSSLTGQGTGADSDLTANKDGDGTSEAGPDHD